MNAEALSQSRVLGAGIGLRRPHYGAVLETHRHIDWLEALSDNYVAFGGSQRSVLRHASTRWPIVCHGVGLNLGATDPISHDYLALLKALTHEISAPWFSDHLCFCSHGNHSFHDLIPVPRTEESIDNLVERIRFCRDYVGLPLAVENVSAYVEDPRWPYSESQFVAEIAERSDCLILLDINNIYVNARNHGLDPDKYLDEIPMDRVVQVHLAGHSDEGDVVIDTHGAKVRDEVWDLYRAFLSKVKYPVATLIEWDNDIPALDVLLDEADKARSILATETGFQAGLQAGLPTPGRPVAGRESHAAS